MSFLFKLLIASSAILISGLVGYVWIRNRRKSMLEKLRSKLFMVTLPSSKNDEKDLEKELGLMEQFFSSILSFNKPIIFEAAVPHVGEQIHFYVSVPHEFSEALRRQINSIWSDALVEEIDDYNIFNNHGETIGGYVKQADPQVLPIRTYKEIGSDTFQGILGGLSKVDEIGEGASIQLIIKPALSEDKKSFSSVLKSLKKGESIKSATSTDLGNDFRKAISGQQADSENKAQENRVDETELKAVEKKLSKTLIRTNIRVMVSAHNKIKAEEIFNSITAGFSQFGSSDRNNLKVVKPRSIKNFSHEFSFRGFNNKQNIILNTEELTSIFHFPNSFTETPKVKNLKSRQLPPPTDLPKSGLLVGESVYRGENKKVYLADNDRRRHLYLIGQTGTGKSNLLLNMMHQDLNSSRGFAVLDPHGDLVEDILGLVPESRRDDVIVFDPSALNTPLGLNMIEFNPNKPEQKTFIVNEMVEIFDKLYDLKSTGGPMFEQYMRNALLLLMEDFKNEPSTLMEVPRLFTDADYRKRKLSRITNPTVIDFWEKEAEKAGGDAALSNITPYITSKFNNFIANDYMRSIIGQTYSSFNFREIMDEGKILLIDLSKGKIGETNSNLLGMIMVGKMLMAALSREDVDQDQRRDFNLYIDEFQNFTTDSIATILSEARKYKLNLVIAHQFIAQLKDNIRDAVFGNVGSKIAFRVGTPDAESLIKEFEPKLAVEDLVNIDNYNAYVRLLINGVTTPPFNIRTLRADAPDSLKANNIKDLSISKYGRNREEVEKDILKRLRQ
ncbi:MAG: DUF87 domain-containing protein [Candidatus Paceibacterota bacterium]